MNRAEIRRRVRNREWIPLERATMQERRPEVKAFLESIDKDDIEMPDEMWVNPYYVCSVYRAEAGHVHQISFRHQDRNRTDRDWRETQRIKNEIAGEEVEAIELYPRMGRLVDNANQFHLWCAPPGVEIELGYPRGCVIDQGSVDEMIGSAQRPLPDDWKDATRVPYLSEDALRELGHG